MRLGRTDTIDEQGNSHVFHQIPYSRLADVRICHHKVRLVDLPRTFLQPFGSNNTHRLGVGYGSNHLTAVVVDTQVRTRAQSFGYSGQMHVYSLLLAIIVQQVAEQVAAERREQLHAAA